MRSVVASIISICLSVKSLFSLFNFKLILNEKPNQITEAVIAIAPINTNAGGKPKYTSVNIPIGINNPVSANQEMAFTFLSLSLKCRINNQLEYLERQTSYRERE